MVMPRTSATTDCWLLAFPYSSRQLPLGRVALDVASSALFSDWVRSTMPLNIITFRFLWMQ